uniref:Putative secreted peptide n=1 Tax=Anopheles braziliensis TaxID=58242 RepID=A0A2M3ZT79_9DIPT
MAVQWTAAAVAAAATAAGSCCWFCFRRCIHRDIVKVPRIRPVIRAGWILVLGRSTTCKHQFTGGRRLPGEDLSSTPSTTDRGLA